MLKNKLQIKRKGIVSIVFICLFIVVYILVNVYVYNKIEVLAQDTLLHSTVTSAESISKSLNADSSKIKYIASEVSKSYQAINSDNANEAMRSFLTSNSTDTLKAVCYISLDGKFYTSNDKTGTISDDMRIKILSTKSQIDIFNPTTQYTYIISPVITNEKTQVGTIIGLFDYSSIFNNAIPTEFYSNTTTSFLVKPDGTVILCTGKNSEKFKNVTNFFKYIDEKKVNSSINVGKNNINSDKSGVFNIAVDGAKYAVAYSQLDSSTSNAYIATIIPSSILLSRSGNLVITITTTSLLFFFGTLIGAYRFYKTLKKSSKQIETIAYQDPLTGFSNFARFKEEAKEILKNNPDKKYYICCADIIGFRYINDAFGYDVGDKILIAIIQNINELLEDEEIFARISGDKFIILTQRNFSDTDNDFFLYKLTDRISTIQPLAKSHIRLEVQMGIYEIQPDDINNMSINAMYDRSLVALYSIEHVDSGVAVYDVEIHNEQIEKKNIESKMHDALNNGEFRIYVQPKYRTNNGKLSAGEALIRWIDPEKGIVPPVKFIPLFEQNRFVHDIDLYVMEVVSRFLRMRLNEGKSVVPISLNISPVELTMPGFKESYISIKDKYNIPDKLIELEFTEGIFFDNEQYFKEIIEDFQAHGFTCSIDDFGSGYSSLNILKSLPVDTLKLDRLFFRESDDISRDRSVVRSVVAMARSLNIKTVAEGVETLDAVEFLKLIGCTLIQGYIYSKPLPLTEFEERLNTEEIDSDTEFEYDFDKFEAVPLDMPLTNSLDASLRRTYTAICEINIGGNIYHIYYPGENNVKFETIPERGFYSNFIEDFAPKYVHPKDIDKVNESLNPINLVNHFKSNKELDFEYRHMKKNGAYSWIKMHIIKASGGRTDSQIFFAYFNVIDTYKETEENLVAFKNRFSSAFSKFNGIVFELDISSGNVEMLESHAHMLTSMANITSYNQIKEFISSTILHNDYREKVTSICSLEYLSNYFKDVNNPSLCIEVMAKPSRKVSFYNYYEVSYSRQADSDKILLSIEDISARKEKEANNELKEKVTEKAYSNIYERIYHIHINDDYFETTQYQNGIDSIPKVTEGKYSLYFDSNLKALVKEEDKHTFEEIFSLNGLRAFYNDPDSNSIKVTYQAKPTISSNNYEWYETLIVGIPLTFGFDQNVYMFIRSIQESRETEKMLNECAHRLSYSLAMFDYAYTVNIDTEKVEVIGGLCFDSELMNTDNMTYSAITMHVKNTEIAEEDRSKFRKFTYLEELKEYFSHNPATISKYFTCLNDDSRVVELTIIYGSREHNITIFTRKLNKLSFENKSFDSIEPTNSNQEKTDVELFNVDGQDQQLLEKDLFNENVQNPRTDNINPIIPASLKNYLGDKLHRGNENDLLN